MTGWAVAVVLAVVLLRLRRRLELVARAEHELRGPLTAFSLGLERVPGAASLHAELERAKLALDDLTAARRGRRAPARAAEVDLERLVRSSAAAWGAEVDWRAGAGPVTADQGRLAQALGNLLSNAAEHGDGTVRIRVRRRRGRAIGVAIANPDRGRGLGIAAAAARDAGARLSVERPAGEFRATLEIPAGP